MTPMISMIDDAYLTRECAALFLVNDLSVIVCINHGIRRIMFQHQISSAGSRACGPDELTILYVASNRWRTMNDHPVWGGGVSCEYA